jgi:hypothetical protein
MTDAPYTIFHVERDAAGDDRLTIEAEVLGDFETLATSFATWMATACESLAQSGVVEDADDLRAALLERVTELLDGASVDTHRLQ